MFCYIFVNWNKISHTFSPTLSFWQTPIKQDFTRAYESLLHRSVRYLVYSTITSVRVSLTSSCSCNLFERSRRTATCARQIVCMLQEPSVSFFKKFLKQSMNLWVVKKGFWYITLIESWGTILGSLRKMCFDIYFHLNLSWVQVHCDSDIYFDGIMGNVVKFFRDFIVHLIVSMMWYSSFEIAIIVQLSIPFVFFHLDKNIHNLVLGNKIHYKFINMALTMD